MDGLKATYQNELFKIRKKKKLIAGSVLSIIAVLIGQVSTTLVNQNLGLLVVNSTDLPLIVLNVMMYSIFPLFVTFLTIDMFNGEYNTNTMKLVLTKPTSRFSIFTAKFLALLTIIALNIVFVMLLSLIIGIAFNFSTVTFIGIVRSIIAYIVSIVPLVVFALFVIILANLVKSGNTVFFLIILSFVLFYVIGVLFHPASSFLFTSMFDWYRLWISDSLHFFKLLRMSLIMIGCSIMLYSIGYSLFERKVI